jgi:hypothetical protein
MKRVVAVGPHYCGASDLRRDHRFCGLFYSTAAPPLKRKWHTYIFLLCCATLTFLYILVGLAICSLCLGTGNNSTKQKCVSSFFNY